MDAYYNIYGRVAGTITFHCDVTPIFRSMLINKRENRDYINFLHKYFASCTISSLSQIMNVHY